MSVERFLQLVVEALRSTDIPNMLTGSVAGANSEALLHRTMFNVVDVDSGWKAELIVRKQRAFSSVELERRERAEIFGVRVDVATFEDVVLSNADTSSTPESDSPK